MGLSVFSQGSPINNYLARDLSVSWNFKGLAIVFSTLQTSAIIDPVNLIAKLRRLAYKRKSQDIIFYFIRQKTDY